MSFLYDLRSRGIRAFRKLRLGQTAQLLPKDIVKSALHITDKKKHGIIYLKIKSTKPFWIKKTQTKSFYLPEVQKIEKKFQGDSIWLAQLKNASVCGPDLAVTTQAGALLADVSIAWEKKAEHHPIFRAPRFRRFQAIEEPAALLAVTGGETYFHWMFEVLPRLSILKTLGRPNTNCRFIVNSLNLRFQQETLAAFGIRPQQCLSLRNWPHLHVKNLWLPSYPCTIGVPSPAVVQCLRRHLAGKKSSVRKRGVKKRKLYLRRARGGRKVLCGEELEHKLKKMGFQCVDPGELRLDEQVDLFSSAEVVLSPHGAGLSNIIFCRPGTKVVEMFSGEYVNLCYQHLAGVCELVHYAVHPWARGQLLRKLNSKELAKNPSNITVEVQDVLEVLGQAGIN